MQYYILTALATAASVAYASSPEYDSPKPQRIQARNIVDSISKSYDFVVVGGGLAGLVLGSRLSENSKHTVLVLEAGSDGSEFQEQIDTPGMAYYNSLWNTTANWNFHTIPLANANNTQMEWPRGKVLGGSSAINGLYMNRPGEIEINAWQEMLGGMPGSDNWSWDALFAAMKKSENFSPPTSAIAKEGDIKWDASSHGTGGPIHMTWPGYTWPMVADWGSAPPAAGVAVSDNTYGGQNWGAYVSMSCINPSNWTRSYSKSGYLDPLPPRANYDVLPNAYVSRLLFDPSSPAGNLSANSVEYTLDGGASYLTVNVTKEVILSGGTIGSPTVLMYSGVGPSDVLSAAGVDLKLNLPGVGQHLQDHVSVEIQWNTTQPTAGSVYDDGGSEAASPEFLSYVNDAVAYVNSSVLFGSDVDDMQTTIINAMNTYAPIDATVATGYRQIYSTVANKIFTSPLGLIELLIGNNENGIINLGASLQHPLSMGSITINSSNPMDYPVIDPAYLTNPSDIQVLIAGLKTARAIGESQPLSSLMTETWPGPSVQSDAEWEEWLRPLIFTEYHPCSTCAMLPRDQGGVVDANLRVYGLGNVRVADASIPPIEFSAHLMSSTYGIAEQASTIINNYWDDSQSSSAVSSSETVHKSGAEGSTGKTKHLGGAGTSAASSVAPRLGLLAAAITPLACIMVGLT